MSSAFASIRSWLAPGSVAHAQAGHVADRGSLVVVCGNSIDIYDIDSERDRQPLRRRFRLRLQGYPCDMKLCRFPGSQYDSILVSFNPARLSRLDFNPDTYRFDTTAMVSYEEPKKKLGNLQDFQPPFIAVDPLQRCIAMAISPTSIMVWPSKERIHFDQVQVNCDVPKGIVSSHDVMLGAHAVVIDLSEYGVKRLKSIAFLNGYLEPSLLVLHEPELTWAGRVAAKPSTCIMTSISINIDTCKHFLIANERDLFYDTHTILPLPMPIGGALAISSNIIIYYKQKIEFALSLNEFGDQCTSLRVVPTASSRCGPITLDRSVCTILSIDSILFGSSDGELFLLSLQTLGDAIRSMDISRVTKTHIPSVLCTLSSDMFFLGSKLGDSLLLQYHFKTEPVEDPAQSIDYVRIGSSSDRALKRMRSGDSTGEAGAAGFDWVLNQAGSVDQQQQPPTTLIASIRDSLFNISPITRLQISMNKQLTPPRCEIIGCSGYDRTGAFVVLDDCVRPSTLATFDLKSPATGIWSALVPGDGGAVPVPVYIVISLQSRTLVKLSENNELKSVESDGFATDVRTLCVGNVVGSDAAAAALVQVTVASVRIMSSSRQWQECSPNAAPLNHGHIVSADIVHPYVSLLMEDGSVMIGKVAAGSTPPEISFSSITLPGRVIAISLYLDQGQSGLFSSFSKNQSTRSDPDIVDEEDLEAMLFGSSSISSSVAAAVSGSGAGDAAAAGATMTYGPLHLMACILTDGTMELISLATSTTIFRTDDVLSGRQTLYNTLSRPGPVHSHHQRADSVGVSNVLLSTLCSDLTARPVMVLSLSNGDILIYLSYGTSSCRHGDIPLAFTKFHHGIITRALAASGIEIAPSAVSFRDIRGLSGLFIAGNRPQWLFGGRDYIHSMPHLSEGIVTAFSQFQPDTFAYCSGNTLRICSFEAEVQYELSIAVRRIPVRMTPHLLAYHADSTTFALVTLTTTRVESIEGDTDRSVPITDKRCQMHLCTNGSMTIVDTFNDFEKEDETILCVEDTPVASGEKRLMFLSVGTANIDSEEVTCRGRLLLFRVHDTTPSDPTGAGYRYNLAFESKEIGPVSAIASVQGFLCVCVGLRVIMYRWDTDRLVGCAFYDADFYTVSLSSAKGFIILADIYNSAHLLYWEPRLKQIMFLGKDPVKTEVYACNFLIDGEDISLVICDGEGNMRLIGYAPYQPDSLGGKRLLRRADIHIGSRISSLVRIRGSDLPGTTLSVGSQYPLIGAAVDGSITCLSPVGDTVYRRLYSLTTLLTYQISHAAGLNPRQFRSWHSTEHGALQAVNCSRNIVDLDFLLEYTSLEMTVQEKMASGIGSTPDQIIDNLLQLQLGASLQSYVS